MTKINEDKQFFFFLNWELSKYLPFLVTRKVDTKITFAYYFLFGSSALAFIAGSIPDGGPIFC